MGMPSERRQACEEIARAAGALVRSRFGRPGEVRGKGMRSESERVYDVVTEVDYLSEQLILERIAALDPDAVALAEEGGLVRADGSPQELGLAVDDYARGDHELWIVDPIDGTVNFAHGIPHFCVSIACWRGGTPVAGAVFDPMVGELFSFEWDDEPSGSTRSAWYDGIPVPSLEQAASARDAMVYVGGSANGRIVPIVKRFRSWRRLGSAALGLAWVGVGRCGAYVQPGNLNAWDWGAGAPFILAAGGSVRMPNGEPWDCRPSSNAGILAASPAVADEIAPLMADVLAGT